MSVDALLLSLSPVVVYVVVGIVVAIESLGVPLPGEIVLVSASLLATRPELGVSPFWVGAAATCGAVLGDSIGYGVGHRHGRRLVLALHRRAPGHLSAAGIAYTEHLFRRYGVLVVALGRFVALLRILAGPLAGVLRMPYARFLPANVVGGSLWAFGTAYAVTLLGAAAQVWLHEFATWGLVAVLCLALLAGTLLGRRLRRAAADYARRHPERVGELETASG